MPSHSAKNSTRQRGRVSRSVSLTLAQDLALTEELRGREKTTYSGLIQEAVHHRFVERSHDTSRFREDCLALLAAFETVARPAEGLVTPVTVKGPNRAAVLMMADTGRINEVAGVMAAAIVQRTVSKEPVIVVVPYVLDPQMPAIFAAAKIPMATPSTLLKAVTDAVGRSK